MHSKVLNNMTVITENYAQLFENRPSKILTAILATLLCLVGVFLCYGIVWYERFGHDQKRTLVNKLTSFTFAIGGPGTLLIHSLEMMRYFSGKYLITNVYILISVWVLRTPNTGLKI